MIVDDGAEGERAAHALRISELRYRRVFEAAKDGILILNFDSGIITDANPYMSELLSAPDGELLGKQLWAVGLFADKQANDAALRVLQDKGYARFDGLLLSTLRAKRLRSRSSRIGTWKTTPLLSNATFGT